MGSMSALINISSSALANAQTAINVTAGNIANQSVAGYTRRVATFSTGDTVSIGGTPTSTGASVAVSAVRDRVLNERVINATESQASADARLSAMQTVDQMFTLDSSGNDAAGIGTAVDALFSSFRSLQVDPNGASSRQAVITAAQNFVDAFQNATARIDALERSLASGISSSLADANATAAQIASLNAKISTSDTGTADTLIDQRQTALVHLAGIIGFNQTSGDNGAINLSLEDGTPLVTGSAAHAIATSMVSDGLQLTSDAGIDVTQSIRGGSIGGALQAFRSDLPEFRASLDTLANGVASAVNLDNSAGLTPQGAAGGALFRMSISGSKLSLSLASSSPSIIAAAAASEGATGSGNAGAIAGLANTAFVGGKTPTAFLSAFITRLGGTVSSAQQQSSTASDGVTQALAQRDAMSGVSLDEEAANLARFQRSYQAAAKIFAIVNDLLAASINLGSQTTVS